MGQNQVSLIERCPYSEVSFIQRYVLVWIRTKCPLQRGALFSEVSVQKKPSLQKLKNVIQETCHVPWCQLYVMVKVVPVCVCVCFNCADSRRRFVRLALTGPLWLMLKVEVERYVYTSLSLCIVVFIVAFIIMPTHSADDRKGQGDGPVSILLCVKVKLSWRV